MFNNPNPTCQNECVFKMGMATTTAMNYDPIYDKNGNNLNPDGNITTSTVSCATCDRQWVSYTQYGQTKYREMKND